MTFKIRCGNLACQKWFSVSEELAGKTVTCPSCKHTQRVPKGELPINPHPHKEDNATLQDAELEAARFLLEEVVTDPGSGASTNGSTTGDQGRSGRRWSELVILPRRPWPRRVGSVLLRLLVILGYGLGFAVIYFFWYVVRFEDEGEVFLNPLAKIYFFLPFIVGGAFAVFLRRRALPLPGLLLIALALSIYFGILNVLGLVAGRLRDIFWMALVADAFLFGAIACWAIFLVDLYDWARRLGAVGALLALRHDPRRPILLLRAFDDDNLPIESDSRTAPSWMLSAPRRVMFEEVVYDLFAKRGPVVAIGRPGERLAPLGAARFWISDDHWQQAVDELLQECQFVVMILGRLGGRAGLTWEADRVLRAGSLEKAVLLVPPVAQSEAAARWREYREFSDGKLPAYEGGELVATFDRFGNCEVLRSSGKRDEAAYRHAILEAPPAHWEVIPSGDVSSHLWEHKRERIRSLFFWPIMLLLLGIVAYCLEAILSFRGGSCFSMLLLVGAGFLFLILLAAWAVVSLQCWAHTRQTRRRRREQGTPGKPPGLVRDDRERLS
jgi:hypothetical protein